ncbi:MAG: hypothetical protein IPH73_05530 [Rhodocyclales bacterium]|nr:hypothetical protein [Rhodocyclales bacterium]
MFDFSRITGFEWDAGNARKNEKHGPAMVDGARPAQVLLFKVRLAAFFVG